LRFDVPEFLVPKSIAEVRELARTIALAEWAPDSYRDLEGNYVQQKIELAIMHGATVGLGPIAAVQSIAVIDGMPTIWGDGALSIVERSGLLEDMLEEYHLDPEEGLTAVCTMQRRRRPTPIINRFSTAMAEQARLTHKEGPWQTYPQRMLKMRARSWSIRDGFADVLRGLHIREEVDDFLEIRGLSTSRPSRAPGTLTNAPRPRWAPLEPESTVETAPAPTGEPGAESEPQDEGFALIDADGAFIEVVGVEALRSGFERIFFGKHLSASQILGVWESNDAAREAIERLLGPEVLDPAAERMRSALAAGEKPAEGQARKNETSDRKPLQPVSEPGSANLPTIYEPRPTRAGERSGEQTPDPDSALVVAIEPTWGDRKVFQHYRARLAALRANGAGEEVDIARFRAANSAIEARLRIKLPQLMQQIDAFYNGGCD
jgi:hypothetical protein